MPFGVKRVDAVAHTIYVKNGHLLGHCRALGCGLMPDCRRSISTNLRKMSLKPGHNTDKKANLSLFVLITR